MDCGASLCSQRSKEDTTGSRSVGPGRSGACPWGVEQRVGPGAEIIASGLPCHRRSTADRHHRVAPCFKNQVSRGCSQQQNEQLNVNIVILGVCYPVCRSGFCCAITCDKSCAGDALQKITQSWVSLLFYSYLARAFVRKNSNGIDIEKVKCLT